MAGPDRDELIPDPITLTQRLDRVTDSLNALRNLVQGQGVKPLGPPALANRVNTAQEEWRALRQTLLREMSNSPYSYDASATIETWERTVNQLAGEAQAAGIAAASKIAVPVTHTVTSPGDAVAVIAERVDSVTRPLLITAAIFLGGLLFIYRRVGR